MKSLVIDTGIVTACVFGILVSTYGFYVSIKSESNPSYKALCDLSDNASCSKVLTSRFSKGLAFLNIEYLMLPNTIYGILVYCALIVLSSFDHSEAMKIQLVLAFVSFATCFYLPYCILCVLNQFCVIFYRTMLRSVNRTIVATCIFGVLVSTYALYVEMAVEAKPGYTAMCDLAQHASCTKVLSSPYAKGLGLVPEDSLWKLPNCIYGTLFYCLSILLSTFDDTRVVRLQQALSLLSLTLCVYLAYILVFILKDFCVVCVTTYLINIYLTVLYSKKHKLLCSKGK